MLLEFKVIFRQIAKEAVVEVHQIEKTVVTDNWLLQWPYFLKEDSETIQLILSLGHFFLLLSLGQFGDDNEVIVFLLLSRGEFYANIKIFFLYVLVEYGSEKLVDGLCQPENLGSFIWTFCNFVDCEQKEMNQVLILDEKVVQNGL